MKFEQRYERGLEALKRAEALFGDWGFTVVRTGVEWQLLEPERVALRGDPEARRRRFSPDLLVIGWVEVKSVKSLDQLVFSVSPWLIHRSQSGTAYLFVDSTGAWLLVPAGKLSPTRVFFTHSADREWLERELPGVELVQLELGSCSGSGEPFAVVDAELSPE